MKTLHAFMAITAVAALTSSPVHAQLFGGSIGGSMNNAVGGALSGSTMDRGGTVDGRFGTDQSLRTSDRLDAGRGLSRPVSRANNVTEQKINGGQKTASDAAHAAGGKVESSRNTAVDAAHAAGGKVESSRNTAVEAGHAAAGEAESSRSTALDSGTSAVHAGNADATDVKSGTASTARTGSANTAPKPQSSLSTSNMQAARGDVATRAPSAKATGEGSAANDTHVSRGADSWSAESRTANSAGASATAER